MMVLSVVVVVYIQFCCARGKKKR